MGNLLAKFTSSKIQPSLLDIDVQSGSTELHNDADNVVPDLSSQSTSTLSSVSFGDTQQDGAVPGPSSAKRIVRKNLSIVSLISSESETSIINHYKQKQNLLEPGEPVSMTDISKIHDTGTSSGQADNGVNTGRSIETEQERLIREEQERLEREQQQQRAKTARMKRRCELYGGSRADISKGDNSIKLAESVLHLIHQNADSTKISSSTSKMQNYLSATKPPPTPNFPHRLKDFGLKSSLDELDTSKAKKYLQSPTNQQRSHSLPSHFKPTLHHRGVSKLRETETDHSVSHSAQYIRSLSLNYGRPTQEAGHKKFSLSPLVTNEDLQQRAVMHSPHQGICGQTSSWRLVPLKNSTNSKTNTNTPKATSSHNYNAKLPACSSRNRAGTLLEGENITMNKIEEFLETREHIDKTEFDMVVRNLLEETSDVGSSGRIQTPKSSNTSSINSNCSFPKFNSSGSHHQNNRMVHTENRFVAAPYHPEQSKFYGKNRFFEPAAYVHLPNVSSKTSNSKKGPENRVLQNLKAEDRRDSSFSSVESEKKGQATASTHEFVENEIIGTDFLMETFNNSQSGSESHGKIKSPLTNSNNSPPKTSSTNLQPSSVKGLPPLGSCSLVTRTNIGQSQQKRHSLPSTEIVELLEGSSFAGSKRRHSLQEPACPHETRTEDCRRGKRPPSRGGRIIKDWLQRKTSS